MLRFAEPRSVFNYLEKSNEKNTYRKGCNTDT